MRPTFTYVLYLGIQVLCKTSDHELVEIVIISDVLRFGICHKARRSLKVAEQHRCFAGISRYLVGIVAAEARETTGYALSRLLTKIVIKTDVVWDGIYCIISRVGAECRTCPVRRYILVDITTSEKWLEHGREAK